MEEMVSSRCGALFEERVLQTYMSDTTILICRACGKNCTAVICQENIERHEANH